MAEPFRRYPAIVQAPASEPWPAREYPRGGWSMVTLTPGGPPLQLTWPGGLPDGPATLRLAVARDDRQHRRLTIRAGDQALGEVEVPYACPLQVCETELEAAAVKRAGGGLALTLQGGDQPFTIATGPGLDEALLPQFHTGRAASPVAAFAARLVSEASLSQFGWMEGCCLDGLWHWHQATGGARLRDGFDLHFSRYPEIVEHCRGIESTLMIAPLARVESENAPLGHAVDFWWARQDQHGCIQDGQTTSCEGSYTVAYPLAVIAKRWRDETLGEVAAHQLRLRRDRLAVDGDIWLRWRSNGTRTYRSWARGCAWYLLGLARTLVELEGLVETTDLRDELAAQAELLVPKQSGNGLWHGFVDEPEVATDSSGSAGVAAALAIGAAHGWLPPSCLAAAQRTREGLLGQLTADGLLGGVCPSNKGEYGEAGQRRAYRGVLGMGMGLMASLLAALGEPAPGDDGRGG